MRVNRECLERVIRQAERLARPGFVERHTFHETFAFNWAYRRFVERYARGVKMMIAVDGGSPGPSIELIRRLRWFYHEHLPVDYLLIAVAPRRIIEGVIGSPGVRFSTRHLHQEQALLEIPSELLVC